MALCSWTDEQQHRMTPMIVTKTMMTTAVITVTMTILANFHRAEPFHGHVALSLRELP